MAPSTSSVEADEVFEVVFGKHPDADSTVLTVSWKTVAVVLDALKGVFPMCTTKLKTTALHGNLLCGDLVRAEVLFLQLEDADLLSIDFYTACFKLTLFLIPEQLEATWNLFKGAAGAEGPSQEMDDAKAQKLAKVLVQLHRLRHEPGGKQRAFASLRR